MRSAIATLHALHARAGRLAGADDHLVGADRLGRDDGAVDHQVGEGLEQRAVLQAGGLPLGSVGHHDRPAPRSGYGAHLRRGGKGRAAAAEQTRALDLLDQDRRTLAHLPPPSALREG